jgi:hypothetical protein
MPKKSTATVEAIFAELYGFPRDRHGRHRSDFVYRGLNVASSTLETSLQRLGAHYVDVESPLLRSFITYSQDRDLANQPLLYQLAVAQHHGLPTRVLDWTSSPRIALHFTVSNEAHFNEDGAIWCVNVTKIRDLLPKQLRNILIEEKAFIFSIQMLARIKTLPELNRFNRKRSFPLFFEPPSLNDRIINQAAILSVAPDPEFDFEDFLTSHPDLYRKITVPKALKWEIRDKLDQDQVNERILFPGLDGTAQWLKRYYGLGPNAGEKSFGLKHNRRCASWRPTDPNQSERLRTVPRGRTEKKHIDSD